MFNSMDYFVARKAMNKIAAEQFSQAAEDAQPEPEQPSLLTQLWERLPSISFRQHSEPTSTPQRPTRDTAEAV